MSSKKIFSEIGIRVTQVTKVFPKVTLKGRVFHPDFNYLNISSLRWIHNYQGLFNAWPIFGPFLALWTSGPIFMAAMLWRMIKTVLWQNSTLNLFPFRSNLKKPLKNGQFLNTPWYLSICHRAEIRPFLESGWKTLSLKVISRKCC